MPLRADQRPMDEWCSPPEIAEPLRQFYRKQKGKVGIDPCSNDRSIIWAKKTYTAGGLHLPWFIPHEGIDSAYSNPPYSRMDKWASRLVAERTRSKGQLEVTFLVPVATSTGWWSTVVSSEGCRLAFTKRLRFIDNEGMPQTTARFDSVLMFWGKGATLSATRRWDEFRDLFADVIRCTSDGYNWRFS